MLKILMISPIKADGTSFYRGWGPFNHLAKKYDIHLFNGNFEGTELSWDLVSAYDLIFFQRPSTLFETTVMDVARKCNKPILIDYDDDYLNIPVTNPRYNLYANLHRREQIKRAIEYADYITTSTLSIKESIVKATGKDRDKIQVIPNGVDETIFNTNPIVDLMDRDVILWRGGDTHEHDIAPYLDKIVKLYEEHPKFKWAFMGQVPEKLLKRIDTSRILLYQFEDVMTYFDKLFELRPRITIVPWEENTFNHGKSNCSFLESTLAGAVTVFPSWSSEFVDGMVGYNNPDNFHAAVSRLMYDTEMLDKKLGESYERLSRFSLENLNSTRMNIISRAITSKESNRLSPVHPKYFVEPKVYTDEQFYNYTHEHGYNQDHPNYFEGHKNVAKWLVETYKPASIVELGCGPGPMLEAFCDMKITQVAGFDINPHFKEYFDKRNPHYKDNFFLNSFLDEGLGLDGVFDLGVSIEVFEHIPEDKLMPFIQKMADHFKVFYFSSTPYRSTIRFDLEWGHRTIKTHSAWIKLFEANGFKYEGNPQKITAWDILLTSTRADSKKSLSDEHINQ